jgi:holo-[acyl-carrier protein] synthase
MIGIGIDLCEIARMERILETGDRFLQRFFTEGEQSYIAGRGKAAAQSMAAMFAAKEALLKALGAGIGGGIALTDIAVRHAESGQPHYELTGAAEAKLKELGGARAFLSLTHEGGMAAAVAVVE